MVSAESPGEIRFVGKNHVATANGSFEEWRFEEVAFDGENWDSARAVIVVDVGSLETGNAKRDDHLRTADFFDSRKVLFAQRSSSRSPYCRSPWSERAISCRPGHCGFFPAKPA